MLAISGSLAYDYIMNFPGYFRDHILPEKLHVLSVSFLVDKMQKNFGGTAGNISYNLALLGEKPTIFASVGNDFNEYRAWLARHHVDCSRINIVKNIPTASCHITTDKSDNQITAFHLGAMQFSSQSIVHSSLSLKKSKIAIVAPGNLEDMKNFPKLYKKLGVSYIYDPGQNIPALSGVDLRAGITGAKVFISNDYELSLVLQKTKWTKQDILKRVEILVTTLGEKGSIIETKSLYHNAPQPPLILRGGDSRNPPLKIRGGVGGVMKFNISPAKPKNVSDPTGAGDAYRAGFIKGLLLNLPLQKVGQLAATVAAYTVEKYGTQTHTFTWPQILARYRANFKQKLL